MRLPVRRRGWAGAGVWGETGVILAGVGCGRGGFARSKHVLWGGSAWACSNWGRGWPGAAIYWALLWWNLDRLVAGINAEDRRERRQRRKRGVLKHRDHRGHREEKRRAGQSRE